ncbi:GtrA family protein [Pararhizobium mangrovi]|uniref:GtrA family protein n=1 Tax=Pararhizobium mangrovi TaxID=2590452 RepID=A0A506U3N7_9HYPH|nr:GtrA family protein [Pararhizobium mangrovi]TPW29003.1 GtrA family protein [Pararhizobium mangrovi]
MSTLGSIRAFTKLPVARFAAVGVVTTALDFLLFTSLHAASLPTALANTISYSCGIAASYHLNRNWTFGVRGDRVRALKFVLSTLTGLVISTFLVTAFVRFAPAPVAKLTSVPIVFVWNYLIARNWVFAGADAKPAGRRTQWM